MSWEGYSSLRVQSTDSLALVNGLVEQLLSHGSMLPPELRAKLDSYHADLADAIEEKDATRENAAGTPRASGETASAEERG